jgi:4-amino-4-deoxy-L-arabinose transferase-like glycosyltransferase
MKFPVRDQTARGLRPAAHRRPALPDWALDLALAALVTALALAARWPHLLTAPAFSDEVEEVLLSLRVARGEVWPLTNVSAYLGPLHAYLLAALLALPGPGLARPRLLVLALGGLTAGLTYLLGRRVAGRAVGLLAGGLLAANPVHLLINSHVAWQHSTAPFWTALALLALRRAWPGGGRWLVAGGALTGLAVQTHPVVALLLPGLALAWGWPGPAPRPGRRAVAAALAAGLLPLLPLLWANLTGGLPALRDAAARPYAYALGAGPAVYRDGLVRLLVALPRALAGAFSEGLPPWLALAPPPVWLAALLALAGLAWGLRRGERLLTAPLLLSLLLLPAVNRDYLLPFQGRYFAHLLPPLAVLVAGVLVAALRAGGRWLARPSGPAGRGVAARPAGALLAGLALALALAGLTQPLAAGLDFARQIEAVGVGNGVVLALAGALRPARGQAVVALDTRLAGQRMPGNTDLLRVMTAVLALEGIPAAPVTLPAAAALAAPPGRVRYLLLQPGAGPPAVAGSFWQACLRFPERTRLGIFSADLYRLTPGDGTSGAAAGGRLVPEEAAAAGGGQDEDPGAPAGDDERFQPVAARAAGGRGRGDAIAVAGDRLACHGQVPPGDDDAGRAG